ncbi:MAG: UDP-N-acetylmuramoyl-tripeptide--D-alanyl-D-alanine ligase [Oscillospiraceae bacterium]|nr:UDP-N-acetylmuramoyl-tripeptide--D-alanyl-D-alanine ligase [Oscillospiraceae bacterium]
MGRITLKQAAAWCGGFVDPKYADVTFLGANNDTRKIQPGQLFLALKGVRDGHDFIPQALEKGAAAVLCEHADGDFPAIVVPDTRIALGQIARGERRHRGYKVVGITGSVGKSTTKEMVAAVLATTYRVAKTPANHNNDIGMPMAILAMPEDTEVAVLEMGMNHFREMAYLSGVAEPDLAVIINIGTMHIEHLGSQEGILKAKLEILECMDVNAPVILNGDDKLLSTARIPGRPVTYFGWKNEAAPIRASEVELTNGCVRFQAEYDGLRYPVELPVEGAHYVPDALAAIAVGQQLRVKPECIQQSLALFQNMAGRQEILKVRGYTVISDCYNAGPESMAAALAVLGAQTGRRIAVLGDMLELGACSQAEHYKVGRIAAEKVDFLLAYGPNSDRMLNGAITGGMVDGKAKAFTDRAELVRALKRLARSGDVILFKGSRGMHMEIAMEQFLADER